MCNSKPLPLIPVLVYSFPFHTNYTLKSSAAGRKHHLHVKVREDAETVTFAGMHKTGTVLRQASKSVLTLNCIFRFVLHCLFNSCNKFCCGRSNWFTFCYVAVWELEYIFKCTPQEDRWAGSGWMHISLCIWTNSRPKVMLSLFPVRLREHQYTFHTNLHSEDLYILVLQQYDKQILY